MLTISFHFRPSTKQGLHKGSIFIRLIYRRKSGNITTPYKVYPHEWNDKSGCVVILPGESVRRIELHEIDSAMNADKAKLLREAERLRRCGDFTVKDLVDSMRSRDHGGELLSFTRKLCLELESTGQDRTARAYISAVKTFQKFFGSNPAKICNITVHVIKKYEENLKSDGKTPNTISFYMRNLRAIYNKAKVRGLLPAGGDNPFAGVYTGVEIRRKRALSRREVAAMNSFDPSLTEGAPAGRIIDSLSGENLRTTLAMFLFGFHARGMSFIDMAYLHKSSIRDGHIIYNRKKTGQQLKVKITPPLQSLLDYFYGKTIGSPYVFPVIDPRKGSERKQYESGLRLQNLRLKKLARIIGIDNNVTTHVARHTWATVARQENLPLWVISEGLGHSSEKATHIYLESLDRNGGEK